MKQVQVQNWKSDIGEYGSGFSRTYLGLALPVASIASLPKAELMSYSALRWRSIAT